MRLTLQLPLLPAERTDSASKARYRFIIFAIMIGLALSISTAPAQAGGPWYVAPAGSDGNDCLAPATACRTIGAALGKATGGDIINVAAGIYTGTLTIDKDVTINGAGAAATIIEPNMQPFTIPEGRTVGIAGVSISNGNRGGVENSGTLTLSDSIISNNDITPGSGGGILNYGTITVTGSLIHHNYGHHGGGGIVSDGTMTLINTTVTDNVAGRSSASCGGVCNGGTMTIVNSTITGNSASLDGGGMVSWGTTIIRNTIIAGNYTTALKINVSDCSGQVVSQGHNVVGGGGCGFTASSDLTGTPDKPLDPLLGPLHDNGGPTPTHALLGGSPAVDAGDPGACPATDQRGIARTWDGDNDGQAVCDVGAYELNVVFTRRAYLPLALRR